MRKFQRERDGKRTNRNGPFIGSIRSPLIFKDIGFNLLSSLQLTI